MSSFEVYDAITSEFVAVCGLVRTLGHPWDFRTNDGACFFHLSFDGCEVVLDYIPTLNIKEIGLNSESISFDIYDRDFPCNMYEKALKLIKSRGSA